MNPTVSVVIPCYNAAAFLRETLDSALDQTHPPLEVILIDDGSTDDSAAIAESYGPPVRVIRQENQGESVARNRGIDEAKGDWIAFLDADDIWKPTKLERQLEATGPDVVAVHTNWASFGIVQKVVDLSTIPAERRYSVERILTTGPGLHISSIMVRASLDARFPEWTRYGEDAIYAIELSRLGKMALVPQVLTLYRRHGGSQRSDSETALHWHRTREEWLRRNEGSLEPHVLSSIRQKLLARLAEGAMSPYWTRDWAVLEKYREYMAQYSDNSDVQAFLAKRFYPPWVYSFRDRVATVWHLFFPRGPSRWLNNSWLRRRLIRQGAHGRQNQ